MRTTIIQVENLKCRGCAHYIRLELRKLEFVKAVRVTVSEKLVKITHEGKEEFVAVLERRLAQMGYPPAGHNDGFLVARSYLSCAMGRLQRGNHTEG